jgi:hypothetical protein
MPNLEATGAAAVGVKLATVPEAVEQAIAAFLGDGPAADGFAHSHVGAYRALCSNRTAGGSVEVDGAGEPILLAGDDGALYVPPAAGEAIEAMLRARRYRPTGSTLALRLPAPSVGETSAGPGKAVTYVLWASPKYLAAGTGSAQVWK